MSEFWPGQFHVFVQIVAFYLPLALAFALVQGITRRVFLSFGEFAMFASFSAIYTSVGGMVHGFEDWVTASASLAMALAAGAALGVVIARVAMGGRLLQFPMAYMVASLGVSVVIQEVMRLRSQSQDIWAPPLFEGDYAVAGVPVTQAWSIAAGLAASALVAWLLARSRFGLSWRACSQQPFLAALCGVDTLLVASQTYALAGGLSGVTGWASALNYGGASFSSGLAIGFKAMFATVVGGFGTPQGAVIGTLFFAAVEVLWSAFFGTSYRDVAIFGIVIVILALKPEGLVGSIAERER